jgi:hypothetical protein
MYTHMYARCMSPTEELTWDDVCELWDEGVYTADDVKKIAPLYFEGAELSAVLEVVEKVDDESATLEAMNPDSEDYLKHFATMKMCVEISNDLEFEHEQNLLEADCDTSQARGNPYFELAWRTLH